MYRATFVFEGRCVKNQEDEDLYDFPKKGETIVIEEKSYVIKSFSILGETIIYILS